MVLYNRDTTTAYKLSEISLEYNATLIRRYVITIRELCAGTKVILYTKVTSIYYQILSKKDTIWKIVWNNLSNRSLQGLLLVVPDKRDDFAEMNDGIPNKHFAKNLHTSDIHPELKEHFYTEHSKVT